MTKWVYGFGGGSADGNAAMRDLLGGKGANLAEMSSLGLLVPPGFTITTEVCTAYYENGRELPDGLEAEVEVALGDVEKFVGAKFGDAGNPLLVSVRSGARASMPGSRSSRETHACSSPTPEPSVKESPYAATRRTPGAGSGGWSRDPR